MGFVAQKNEKTNVHKEMVSKNVSFTRLKLRSTSCWKCFPKCSFPWMHLQKVHPFWGFIRVTPPESWLMIPKTMGRNENVSIRLQKWRYFGYLFVTFQWGTSYIPTLKNRWSKILSSKTDDTLIPSLKLSKRHLKTWHPKRFRDCLQSIKKNICFCC